MKRRLIAVLVCWLALLPGLVPTAGAARPAAGSIDREALDAAIAEQMARQGFKGVALAVTQGDQIAYLQGYGSAGGGRPMTAQTPLYIGSQSKSFTALAAAQLVEQGLIDLRAPVQTYLPWFTTADPAAAANITVSHLLHHTSGLSEAGFTTIIPLNATREQAVRALASAELTAEPGAEFQYFNLNYVALAAVIEAVTSRSTEQVIQQAILDPLQMSHTYTDPELARQNGLSQGYTRFFGVVVPQAQRHPAYELPAGYIMSTAEDLAHYAIAMNNQGRYAGASVLSERGMERLLAPVQGYAMGWFVQPGHIYHGGANETFKTFVDLYPGRGLGIVLLVNQGYMLDHYISSPQLFAAVEAAALGQSAPASNWLTVRLIGLGLLALVLGLLVLHAHNFRLLKSWRARARTWSRARVAGDVLLSFAIPTLILLVVFSQIKGFFGYRFNLTFQMRVMFRTLTDISILMLVGSVPDYLQGLIKLVWVLRGRSAAVREAA